MPSTSASPTRRNSPALNRSPGADPNEVNLVHEAYHVLCMPNERAAYDAKLISMAEKAAAREAAQNLDLVLEPDEDEAPRSGRTGTCSQAPRSSSRSPPSG